MGLQAPPHPSLVSSSGSSTKAVSDLSIVKGKVCVRWSPSGLELCPLLKDTLESYLPEPVIVTVFGNRVLADGITEVKMRSDWSVCVCVLSRLSRVRLCVTPSTPGSSVQGILQARILEWVVISSSRGFSRLRDRTCVSYISSFGRQVLYHWCHLGSPYPGVWGG